MPTATQSATQKPALLDALITKRSRIDELIAQVQKKADQHFDLAPGDCHWGHAGDLDHLIEYLEYALGIERE
ncbi:hypothetical protein [Parendozoicomonas sp. Alg238-R29]|uniref:hypothetical protein n=1 Tax=Parendozoicomonas sp. Alg238-R29 TaxID=2993446 RepID=UPI00248E3CC8|nr:hypothetical protein [Parendozoicomonas sp. Alg238-R29]